MNMFVYIFTFECVLCKELYVYDVMFTNLKNQKFHSNNFSSMGSTEMFKLSKYLSGDIVRQKILPVGHLNGSGTPKK